MEGGVWGIIIIIAGFMIQFFIFGVSSSIGVYNIEFLEHFTGASAAEVSLISALNFGVFFGVGPVVSFLMTKFTFRKIALGGSLLVVLGTLSAPVLPHLPVMYVTLGILTGFGSCCAYIPSHTLSGLYYDKYRSLATGVATSGSGLGGAAMPALIGVFIEMYSWKGSFIILSGLCLHLFVFAALLRDPPELIVTDTLVSTDEKDIELNGNEQVKNQILISKDEVNHDGEKIDVHHLHGTDRLSWRPGAGSLSTENLHLLYSSDDKKASPPTDHCLDPTPTTSKEGDESVNTEKAFDVDAKHTNAILDLEDGHEKEKFLLKSNEKKESSNQLEKEEPIPDTSRHIYVFKSYNFDVYFVNNMFWNVSASVLMSFVPEYLRLHDMTAMEAAWLTGALGLGCFVGGILGGIIGNIKGVDRVILFSVACLLMGIITIIIPLGRGKIFYGFMLLIDGTIFGIILGLLIVVLTDLIGVESLGNGMGYLMLSNGMGTFIGPVLAGVIIDSTGDFGLSIYFSGIMAVAAGLVMLLITLRQHLNCKKRISGFPEL